MNVYFDCDSGFRQRNALTADRFGGVTEMPLFSDKVDHGSTNGRYHACGIHRARRVTVVCRTINKTCAFLISIRVLVISTIIILIRADSIPLNATT